jgi:flagellar biosynthesis chaperone FliJ
MSTSTERWDDVSRSFFIASRINLQNRKQQMQKNIKRLLKEKSSETINDSTTLRMFKVVDELLSLLFIKNSDIKQKLMNINKKLKRIDSNTFKTKTDIDTYAIAVKKKRFNEVEETQNARRELVAKTKQQKIFMKFKRRKTCRILLTDERMNCYCCLSKMNEKFSLLYRKSFSFIYLLIFHLLIHRDSSENRDLRLSRRFFLLIKLSSFFVVTSIWSHQNRIFIFELIDLSTISKINRSERNHLDWITVERLDAKSTNWWRIDDTNRLNQADAIRSRIVYA